MILPKVVVGRESPTPAYFRQSCRSEPLWFRLSLRNELSLLGTLCYNKPMRNVRRYFKEGKTYFLTHVTYQRQPILVTHTNMSRHVDYIHYNPVRHGLVTSAM